MNWWFMKLNDMLCRRSILAIVLVLLILGTMCFWNFVPRVKAVTTVSYQVSASSDDCYVYEATTAHPPWVSIDTVSDVVYCGYQPISENYGGGGARFLSVEIPGDATITAAYFNVSCSEGSELYTSNLRLAVEDVDSSSTFSTVSDYNGRSRTDYVYWMNISYWSGVAQWYPSPDISSLIQSVIDRDGWSSGNNLTVFMEDIGNSTYDREFYNYDLSTANAPKLEITYFIEADAEDYVDSQSDVDSTADVGTHSNFTAQQATDWINDTLTEFDSGTIVDDSENYVDNNSSDVDSHANHGAFSNFTAEQDSNIAYNDTLTEVNTGGTPVNVTYVNAVATGSSNPTSGSFSLPDGWAANDVGVFWWYTRTSTKTFIIYTATGLAVKYNVSSAGYGRTVILYRVLQTGDTTFAWTSSSVANADVIWGTSVFRYVYSGGDPFEAASGNPATYANSQNADPPAATVASFGSAMFAFFGKNNDYGSSIAAPSTYTLCGSAESTAGTDASAGAAYKVDMTAGSKNPDVFTLGGASTDDGYVWTGVLKSNSSANYELDLEFQWTTADYDDTNEYLCIRTGGALDSESLKVDVRDGSSWTTLITITSSDTNTWENVSIGSYLSSATITFRFLGGTEASDLGTSTWSVECALVHVWNLEVNYRLQLEEQFTWCNYSRTNEELCVRMGDFNSSETLKVEWWNATSSSWTQIVASLNENGWTNTSVTSYLTAATFTIRFVDGTTTSDADKGTWDKDACLLHTWDGGEENYAPTNDACDSTATFSVNVDDWVNMTVSDANLVADLYAVEINITTADGKNVILNWTQSTNTFTEVSDSSSVCTLNTSSSTRVNVDSDTDRICFLFKLSVSVLKGNCNVTSMVTDDSSSTDTDTYTNEFALAFYSSIVPTTVTHTWTNATAGVINQLIDEDWINFTVTANAPFDVQAKGGGNLMNGSYVINIGNVTIHKDTLESSVSLTLDYADVDGWTSQSVGENLALYVKLWLSVPSSSKPWLDYTYTLYLQVIEA